MDGPEWREALSRAAGTGPGGAGVGTFMSPCEKPAATPSTRPAASSSSCFFGRWHPSRAKEILCAAGRMLYLSLWPPQSARPDNATLHRRCHEMGDLLLSARS